MVTEFTYYMIMGLKLKLDMQMHNMLVVYVIMKKEGKNRDGKKYNRRIYLFVSTEEMLY